MSEFAGVLQALSSLEAVIQAQATGGGTFKEQFSEDALHWAFERSREVHAAYADLCMLDNDAGLEALKRGLYMQWIPCIEPSELTGIPGGSLSPVIDGIDPERPLDADAQKVITAAAIEHLNRQHTDTELLLLMGWFQSVADWGITEILAADGDRKIPTTITVLDLKPCQWNNRGSLGNYMQIMCKNS